MLLSCSDICKEFPDKVLFSGLSFSLDKNEKMAILGPNGCGKSTLLKIIVKEIMPDSGSVNLQDGVRAGYLAQYQDDELDGGILDIVLNAREDLISMEKKIRDMEYEMKNVPEQDLHDYMEKYNKLSSEFENKGGLVFRSLANGILKGLGFEEDEFDKPFNCLSGGQKTRVSLGRLLLSNPDILILDEPTNHLDIHSVEWLESFLQKYDGSVILVSHDRYFLDNIIDHALDISADGCRMYTGNYTEAEMKKKAYVLEQQRAYDKQQDKIQHEEKVIETLQRFNREKSIRRAESRKKVLDKMTLLSAPEKEAMGMRLSFKAGKRSGNDVLEVTDLKKSFDNQLLFSNLSFHISRGDRLAILGDNGTGKTTLLRIINGILDADAGNMKIGASVDIGYYDQGQQNLDESNTVFSELRNSYPDINDTGIRNVLAAFDFKGDEVKKSVSALSGGERGRLSLSKLMLKESNFLILDEPTNHLDIKSKEILEDALQDYEGTILFVSHDRYFINRVADRILVLDNSSCQEFLGNYDDYIEKRDRLNSDEKKSKEETEPDDSSKLDYDQQKREKAARKKLENELAKVEKTIDELESEISSREEEMSLPEYASDSSKLNEINKIITACREKLESEYKRWDELSELL